MITVEDLSKVFYQGRRSVKAVTEADLNIRKGERVFIHGPSGAGKSTLLHVMGGLMRPDSGRVRFLEKDIYRISDRKRSRLRNRNFGFIFQFYYLLPELKLIQNVMMPAMIKGGGRAGKIRQKAESLLELTGLTQRKDHHPFQLSGGEAQRAAIARALINSPDVIYCDEPTGNLDSEMSQQIYDLLYQVSESSRMSVVVVSHQKPDTSFYDKSYYMKDGRLAGEAGHNESTDMESAGM